MNDYVEKVAGEFFELWVAGSDFEDIYNSVIPNSILDVEHYDAGDLYYYEDEEIELGCILYRLKSFFKYSGHGYKASSDEVTIQSVLNKYIILKDDIPEQRQTPIEPNVKLSWNCSPAIAGYIISELVKKGYIEPPVTKGELSYAKLASICNQLFDIRSNGKVTSLDYLKKVVNPESNTLSDQIRSKLNLPDLDQLK